MISTKKKRGRQPSSYRVLASGQVPILPSRPDRPLGTGTSREANPASGIAALRLPTRDRAKSGIGVAPNNP
jgi:hypothetical protein